jgi:hypothetical protein
VLGCVSKSRIVLICGVFQQSLCWFIPVGFILLSEVR